MLAANAARVGDTTKCAAYVENIASVFFPVDGGDDPVWPNAANNAFKRTAYGLIDFLLEEERELRQVAIKTKMGPEKLLIELDNLWAKATLYNCYQMFTQLTSSKVPNPAAALKKRIDAGEFENAAPGELEREKNAALKSAEMFEDKPEMDSLSLFFAASSKLPTSELRKLVMNTDNALKSMAGAEKMLASVYGIAITAMSFFTDPTISTLTSGTPSQNIDLAGLSFPRRIGFRLHTDYMKKRHLVGMQAIWSCYADPEFKENLGKDFTHDMIIDRTGWARGIFGGIFENDKAYLKCQIKNPQSGQLIKTFYFEFNKSYLRSLNGKTYVKDPVLQTKIPQGGTLRELVLNPETKKYVAASSTFKIKRLYETESGELATTLAPTNMITQTDVAYEEKPKIVFLVTPPHLMQYAKLILILIKQLVDLNFDSSYVTKEDQKPYAKTMYMLDELGNLQSDGKGIDGFETHLSIGLGQDQRFTLILQTLQQIKDVYGDSADKIIQGNVSNIIFLKSTDDDMIDTLSKMSGRTHRTRSNSKTVTQDKMKLMMRNEGKVSITRTTEEEAVLTYNDFAFISERNSIILRAGDAPIWNRNETILPMSWRLHLNQITQPGKKYTFLTVPTLSTAKHFDVRQNQPDFKKFVEKRVMHAMSVDDNMDRYKAGFGYSDLDIHKLDPDNYADDIMQMVFRETNAVLSKVDSISSESIIDDYDYSDFEDYDESDTAKAYARILEFEENEEGTQLVNESVKTAADQNRKIYARGTISKLDIYNINTPDPSKRANHGLDDVFIDAYKEHKNFFARDPKFNVSGDSLYSKNNEPFIIAKDSSEALASLKSASKDPNTKVYDESEGSIDDLSVSYEVTDEFLEFLSKQRTWKPIVDGRFEMSVAKQMQQE